MEKATKVTTLAGAAMVLVLLTLSGASQAAFVLTDDSPIGGNDCAGVFGRPFAECEYEGSPIIIKFNYDKGTLGVVEINPAFSSVTGNEFSIVLDGTGEDAGATGSWSYTPTGSDPGITAFAVKAGNSFNVYAGLGTSGSWETPDLKGLSHISFYDTAIVPLPAALPLLGTGLLSLWAFGRRRSKQSQSLAA